MFVLSPGYLMPGSFMEIIKCYFLAMTSTKSTPKDRIIFLVKRKTIVMVDKVAIIRQVTALIIVRV